MKLIPSLLPRNVFDVNFVDYRAYSPNADHIDIVYIQHKSSWSFHLKMRPLEDMFIWWDYQYLFREF
jgi:hypothetical protein